MNQKPPNDPENQGKAKSSGAPMGGSASFASKMMRSMVESTPTSTSESNIADLPDAPFPSMENLEVHVPEFPSPSEDDVMERFEHIYYQLAPRKIRKAGEPLEMGDEILIDMVAYIEGRVVPFSAQESLTFQLEENSIMTGFGKELEGVPVGDSKVLTITLGDDYEIESLRGRITAFVVQVHGAATIDFPEPNSPEMLKAYQMGETMDEILLNLAKEMNDERSALMVLAGIDMVLRELASRILVKIPSKLIDDEIRSWWGNNEGRFLLEKGLGRQDLDEALEGWLEESSVREDAEFRLQTAMLIKSYLLDEKPTITKEEVQGFMREFAGSLGLDPDVWMDAVKSSPSDQEAIIDRYLYLRTVAHIMADATVHYGE